MPVENNEQEFAEDEPIVHPINYIDPINVPKEAWIDLGPPELVKAAPVRDILDEMLARHFKEEIDPYQQEIKLKPAKRVSGVEKLKEKVLAESLKKQEEESNLIRIDLDAAARELAIVELGCKHHKSMEELLEMDEYLNVYDKYYDILFKSKA